MNASGWRTAIRFLLVSVLAVPATVFAADLPPLPPGLSAPSKATKLPAFSLTTAAGGSVKADDYKGKVIIARFWATW